METYLVEYPFWAAKYIRQSNCKDWVGDKRLANMTNSDPYCHFM